MHLVDVHAHLEQISDLAQALSKARAAKIVAIIAAGMDSESNQQVLGLARDYPDFIFPALGLHPWSIKVADLERSYQFIKDHAGEAVAIGEIGLDYHKKLISDVPKVLQQQVLREVLEIARTFQKPVVVHSRYAWRDALALVEAAGMEKAVFHWYTGTSSVLRDIVNRGYYLSATPAVQYHEEHRRAIKEVPLERLLLETDAPVTYRPQTGPPYEARPIHVLVSLKYVAELRGLSEEALAETTTRNALSLFQLPAKTVE